MSDQIISAPRFWVMCSQWTAELGFSELAGVNSLVEPQEYWYSDRLGNTLAKQFGRAKPAQLTLKRALDTDGFAQLFTWHTMARMNNPLAKVPALFTMMSSSGDPQLSCYLENAWCSRVEIDPAQAGATSTIMIKVTIECDAITPA